MTSLHFKRLALATLALTLCGQAIAADLSPEERRRLDGEVLHERRVPREVVVPYTLPRASSYSQRGTVRVCVDDADGITCSYKNFPLR